MVKLLIVESPTKTKTLKKFLGKGYKLASTGGHILDLPKSKLGVDIDNNFKPQYITIKGKNKVLEELKKLSKNASLVYLAPDPDREGEAIAYHVAMILGKIKGKLLRITFNEITKRAVLEAIKNAGKIDIKKVYAQQARRILDRLVGYQVSPLLWKMVTYGLSAGRVQSVALRMICERENEIKNFVPQEYWTIDAEFITGKKEKIYAKLTKINDKKPEIDSHSKAIEVCDNIKQRQYKVSSYKKGTLKRQSPPPFITSSLQQDAFAKLGFNNKKTMRIAQQLYEGIDISEEGQTGLITYMRTDSFRIADEAKVEARKYISSKFGDKYLPTGIKKYKTRKLAQEAHEAIRPTSVFRTPQKIKKNLTSEQNKLYNLIWSRFVASQMADAEYRTTTVEISGGEFVFKAHHQEMIFDGFLKVYKIDSANDDKKRKIPEIKKGVALSLKDTKPEQHFTQPPPRFNAGSLVKELEEKGIGRPSTYAQIISTLGIRKYVTQEKRRFKPTDLGMLVNKILIDNFPGIFNTAFTASMEDELDRIEEGKENWVDVLNDFYTPFQTNLKKVEANIRKIKKQTIEYTDKFCEKCGAPMVIKFGRNGRFLACSAFPKCKNTKPLDETVEQIDKKCPNCGAPMEIRQGRFGRFIACSRYPECKTTEPISTGVKCPEKGCDGELLERRSKKGRIFYSCSRYPKCKFSLWFKPVPRKCPACGYSFMVEKSTIARGDYLYCTNCKHHLAEEKAITVKS
ncbi:MAG: type I DNA topoisomerase [Candidatus Zixiibacteriota bacterium]|nr:MAG: type I DNA topoisomerase [candidate division Zixibacteria bacterium]